MSIGQLVWKIAVALYLLANGILGIGNNGDYREIFSVLGNDTKIFVIVAGVISLIAGVFILLELFNIKIDIVNTLIFIIAIIWAVFVVLRIISALGSFNVEVLAQIAIYLMVLGSLLVASGKFGD